MVCIFQNILTDMSDKIQGEVVVYSCSLKHTMRYILNAQARVSPVTYHLSSQ